MAITYPLNPAAFWDLCKFSSYTWDLQRFQGSHQRRDGRVISYELGSPKWGGNGALQPNAQISDSVTLMAKFGMLRGSLGTFLAYDKRRPYPLLDPTGGGLSGYTPQVNSISADRDKVSIKGLPSTYTITAGDYLSIIYNTSYYALLRAMETVTASAGVTAQFYVETNVPSGIAANDNVNFLKPLCICQIIPGSFRMPSNDAGTASGAEFSWIQVR